MNSTSIDALKEADVAEISSKSDLTLEAAKATVAKNDEQLTAVEQGDTFEENKVMVQLALRKLSIKNDFLKSRITRVNQINSKLRELKKKKEFLELAQIRAEVSQALRRQCAEAGTKPEDLATTACKAGDGLISEAELLAFLKGTGKLPESLDDGKLKRLFSDLADGDAQKMPKETLQRLTKTYYKVCSATVLTEDLLLKDARTVRRLEEGEVFEVEGVEAKDEDATVVRVKGRATKDGVEGFATLTGNQGTKFLTEGGDVFKALMPVDLHDAAAIEGANKLRALRPGELLQVVQWGNKQDVTGTMRIRVKAQADGVLGWVTWFKEGHCFLQVA